MEKDERILRKVSLQRRKRGVGGVNREGVVIPLQVVFNGEFQGLEVEQHAVFVKLWPRDDHFDLPRVAVREAATLWVPTEHVPAFDSEQTANAEHANSLLSTKFRNQTTEVAAGRREPGLR